MFISDSVKVYQKELTRIKKILKNNPKGMTVTDISREMNINRNSVAKYLDILLISGHAELITFGPAKVFFPSRRVPISSVLNFISDYIIILDEELKITQVNDTFLEFLGVEREDLIGTDVEHSILKIFKDVTRSVITEALNGKEFTEEISLQMDEDFFYFKVRLVPTIFENGGQGITIILTDITEKKRIEKILQLEKKKFKINK